MASEKRQQRVAEQIRKELGLILMRQHSELAAGLTLSEVRLSPDLSHARIFVSAMGTPEQRAERLKGLFKVARDMRRELAARLRIRAVPQLRFLEDESLDRVDTVERLLEKIREERSEGDDSPVDGPDAVDEESDGIDEAAEDGAPLP